MKILVVLESYVGLHEEGDSRHLEERHLKEFESSAIDCEIIYIKKRQLTNCLELLQRFGYSNETAVKVLAHLQREEVGA